MNALYKRFMKSGDLNKSVYLFTPNIVNPANYKKGGFIFGNGITNLIIAYHYDSEHQ